MYKVVIKLMLGSPIKTFGDGMYNQSFAFIAEFSLLSFPSSFIGNLTRQVFKEPSKFK